MILGISRSGTTLVRRILDAHPEISAPAETLVLSAAARFLHSQPLGSGADYSVLTGLALAGFPPQVVLERLAALALGFHREHAARSGARLWAEKTATDVFHLPKIEQLCGDRVRYVCVLRNGLDVAPSLLELADKIGGWFPELHAYVQREPRPLVAMARAWADATDAMLDLLERRPDQVHLVRYEALVHEPEPTLDALADALALPRPASWLADALGTGGAPGFGDWKTWSTDALHTDSIDRHQQLDRAALSAMIEVAAPALERAGYPVPEPITAEQARRRAELAMRLSALRRG